MIEQYRRLALTVDAVQWDPDGDTQTIFNWLTGGNAQWGLTGNDKVIAFMAPAAPDGTPSALILMKAQPGDWIIRGVNGDFYCLDSGTFSKTYEQAPSG